MLIVCPSCATSYKVEPQSLGEGGRSVRCARCRNVWFATMSAAVATLPGSDDWDIVDNGPRVPAVDTPVFAAQAAAAPAPAHAATDGIDVAGLRADIDGERAREMEADAVLAEVTQPPTAPAETDAPPLAPAAEANTAASPPTVDAQSTGTIESFAQRRARRKARHRGPRRKLGLPAAIAVLAAANIGLAVWRNDIARYLPQTAAFYAAFGIPVNLRGLAFENVQMSRIEQEGIGVMVVEGSIVNVTKQTVEVPKLRLGLRNDAKQEIYSWTAQPARSILEPGFSLPFRARLASPPADAREVEVRFFHKRDMTAGLN